MAPFLLLNLSIFIISLYAKSAYSNGYSTHTRLVLGWHTGVEIGGNPAYGGTRFFSDSPGVTTTEIMSVGAGDSNIRITNNLYVPFIYDRDNTGYYLQSRVINTTYVSIPLALKLCTYEYKGMRYFGSLGGELAFRLKVIAKDTYYQVYNFGKDSVITSTKGGTKENLNLGGTDGDALAGVVRVGMNFVIGCEYRLGGTTALFGSINYFKSFTSLMRSESKYLIYKNDPVSGDLSYIKQNLIYNAVRVSVGIMF